MRLEGPHAHAPGALRITWSLAAKLQNDGDMDDGGQSSKLSCCKYTDSAIMDNNPNQISERTANDIAQTLRRLSEVIGSGTRTCPTTSNQVLLSSQSHQNRIP